MDSSGRGHGIGRRTALGLGIGAVGAAARPTPGPDGLRGTAADRNVELLLATPAGLVT